MDHIDTNDMLNICAPCTSSRQSYNGDFLSFHRDCTYEATTSYALHCHSGYEIYYFIGGKVSYLVEGKKYTPTPHSVLLLAPNVFHGVRIESEEGYERMSIHFSPSTVLNENASLLLAPFTRSENSEIYFEHVDALGLPAYFDDICAGNHLNPDMKDSAIQLRVQNLLFEIVHMIRSKHGSAVTYDNASVKRMIQYLNQHLTEEITLDNLSKQFFISKYYLNTLFKKATGTTIMNYVIHKRVALAKRLMIRGDTPARAAEAAGFQDYSSFFRAYKKIYGKAPSQL